MAKSTVRLDSPNKKCKKAFVTTLTIGSKNYAVQDWANKISKNVTNKADLRLRE